MTTDARDAALTWIGIESELYQTKKFPEQGAEGHTPEQWAEIIGNYLQRAKVLGLDNPLGRQAVGKAAAISVAYLETMFHRYGSLPAPGFPSGEIRGTFSS